MAGAGVVLTSVAGVEEPSWWRPKILEYATFDRVQGVVLMLAVFLTCGLTSIQGDTWWQLRAGRDMWASGHVLLSDTYSHTAFGAFWSNHEWLAEVIFYAVYQAGGLPLLTLFAATLITGGWILSWNLTKGPASTAFLLMLVALTSAAGWWEPRPHAFSLLFIPWTVFLLHRDRLRWLPLLFLAWANSHGGVLLGFVLVCAGLAGRTLIDRSLWRESLVCGGLIAVAMTLTPLGAGFWIEIPKSLSRISGYTLDEWSRTELMDPTLLPFWGIAAMYAWEVLRRASRAKGISPAEAAVHACALACLPLAVVAVRNVGPFLMIAVPALTYLWADGAKGPRIEKRDQRTALINAALLMSACAGVVFILSLAYAHKWDRLKWTPIPQVAIDALDACPDNLYNRYDEGGMLLWFVPQRRVFLDGRQDPFPPALVLEHIEMETGRRHYGPTFARHEIRCAFLPVVSPVAARLEEDGWTTLHRDSHWMVMRKR